MLIGHIIHISGLKPQIGFLYRCHLTYVSGALGKDNVLYWKNFGNVYLDSKNNNAYESQRDHNFRSALVTSLKSEKASSNRTVVELGGGYFQNLIYLDSLGLDLELYNVDVAPIPKELIPNLSNFHLVESSVEDLQNYENLLNHADLVFTFGLWMYLDEATFIKTIRKIVSASGHDTQFVFAEPARDSSTGVFFKDLQESHRRSGGTYIHNYTKILSEQKMTVINEVHSPTSNLMILQLSRAPHP